MWLFDEASKKDESVKAIGRDKMQQILDEYINQDLVLSFLDLIQAPLYERTDAAEVLEWANDCGFLPPKRLTRYPRYQNIRKFLAPIYYHYQHRYSILYNGQGCLQYLMQKPAPC